MPPGPGSVTAKYAIVGVSVLIDGQADASVSTIDSDAVLRRSSLHSSPVSGDTECYTAVAVNVLYEITIAMTLDDASFKSISPEDAPRLAVASVTDILFKTGSPCPAALTEQNHPEPKMK